MENAQIYSSDVAFTPAVKAVQSRKGSRRGYARMEEGGSWETTITPELAAFIEEQTSVFLATASKDGQPYIQHRGGPQRLPARARREDDRIRRFRRQPAIYHQGNLAENPRAHLFLIDYAHRRRIKIWGEARVVEDDADLMAKLMPKTTRRGRSRSSFSPSPPGIRTAPSTSRSASKPPMSRRSLPNATPASRRLKRRSNG